MKTIVVNYVMDESANLPSKHRECSIGIMWSGEVAHLSWLNFTSNSTRLTKKISIIHACCTHSLKQSQSEIYRKTFFDFFSNWISMSCKTWKSSSRMELSRQRLGQKLRRSTRFHYWNIIPPHIPSSQVMKILQFLPYFHVKIQL